MSDYSKATQTAKTKKTKEKRMSVSELSNYEDTIMEECNGICQLCEIEAADDLHHPIFGAYGADKDDRYQIAACRGCHTECHKSKHGELSTRAKEIAAENWRVHSGEV